MGHLLRGDRPLRADSRIAGGIRPPTLSRREKGSELFSVSHPARLAATAALSRRRDAEVTGMGGSGGARTAGGRAEGKPGNLLCESWRLPDLPRIGNALGEESRLVRRRTGTRDRPARRHRLLHTRSTPRTWDRRRAACIRAPGAPVDQYGRARSRRRPAQLFLPPERPQSL